MLPCGATGYTGSIETQSLLLTLTHCFQLRSKPQPVSHTFSEYQISLVEVLHTLSIANDILQSTFVHINMSINI